MIITTSIACINLQIFHYLTFNSTFILSTKALNSVDDSEKVDVPHVYS